MYAIILPITATSILYGLPTRTEVDFRRTFVLRLQRRGNSKRFSGCLTTIAIGAAAYAVRLRRGAACECRSGRAPINAPGKELPARPPVQGMLISCSELVQNTVLGAARRVTRLQRVETSAFLQWARASGCPLGRATCRSAAGSGHLDTLQWTCSENCSWDATACSSATASGHLGVLQWARANGCD